MKRQSIVCVGLVIGLVIVFGSTLRYMTKQRDIERLYVERIDKQIEDIFKTVIENTEIVLKGDSYQF